MFYIAFVILLILYLFCEYYAVNTTCVIFTFTFLMISRSLSRRHLYTRLATCTTPPTDHRYLCSPRATEPRTSPHDLRFRPTYHGRCTFPDRRRRPWYIVNNRPGRSSRTPLTSDRPNQLCSDGLVSRHIIAATLAPSTP